MGFGEDESLNALRTSDWDPAIAVGILCGEQSSLLRQQSSITFNVLESPVVQGFLSDPEIFMSK